MEPTCFYCNASTKFRCKTEAEAKECQGYKSIKKIKDKIMSEEQVTKLAEMSIISARNTIGIIDALAQRGAFRGEEFFPVGQLREQQAQILQLAENLKSTLAAKDEA